MLSRVRSFLQSRKQLLPALFGFLTGTSLFLTIDIIIYVTNYQAPVKESATKSRHLAAQSLTAPSVGRASAQEKSDLMIDIFPKRSSDEVYVLQKGIPMIVHQTWESSQIPVSFVPWMKSWMAYHGHYHYVFWTPLGASRMIARRFPALALYYRNFRLQLQKHDARKYFILYQYGGLYSELDMETTRDMTGLLSRYECVLARYVAKGTQREEPDAARDESHGSDSARDYFVSPDFMACRPGHPFFKLVLQRLPQYSAEHDVNLLNTTGPVFLSRVLHEYLRTANTSAHAHIHVIPARVIQSTYTARRPDVTALCDSDDFWQDKNQFCDYLNTDNSNELDDFSAAYLQRLFGAHFTSKTFVPIHKVIHKHFIV